MLAEDLEENHVFKINEEQNTILRYIAIRPLNISQLSKKTEKHTTMRLGRCALGNKIYGTKTHRGLIQLGFIVAMDGKKHPANNQEKTFFLTIKGFLAVIDHGVNLKKTHIFKSYQDFINRKISDIEVQRIIENYIMNQIQFFLLWHAIRGLQLTIIPHFYAYYRIFANKSWKDQLSIIPINLLDEKSIIELKVILSEYVKSIKHLKELERTLHTVIENRRYHWPDECIKNIEDENGFCTRKSFDVIKIPITNLISNWYDYISFIQEDHHSDMNYIQSHLMSPISNEDSTVLDFENEIIQIVNSTSG